MKAIIDGRRYDTETAEGVASYCNGLSRSDFRFLDETLFLTTNGSWFIAGQGGALTDYAETVGDGYGPGEAIRPIEPEEAMAWLEEHGALDALECHFAQEIVDA